MPQEWTVVTGDYMWKVLLAADYTTVGKPDPTISNDAWGVECFMRSSIIWGSKKTVLEKIMDLREKSGPFGTLLMAMTDGSSENFEREHLTMQRLAELRPLIKRDLCRRPKGRRHPPKGPPMPLDIYTLAQAQRVAVMLGLDPFALQAGDPLPRGWAKSPPAPSWPPLLNRARTGQGVSLAIPMFETMATLVLQEHLAAQSFDPPVGPYGDQRLLSPFNQPLQTKDGFFAVTINSDPQVKAFLVATGRSHLATDPRFASVAARAVHVKEWFEVRGTPLTGKTSAEWLALIRAADIAAMPVHTIETLRYDPHLTDLGLLQPEVHPTEGRTTVLRSSILADGATLPLRAPSAAKGGDTAAVLAAMGFSKAEVEALEARGAVV